ncbi:Mur ligase family protein [Hespellia stercorisuis]|uniref:Lipid II isoglutaminyl synthase (glutamine-hydrolyzing) subunit MurT n=1 Tax=Hespellia stercorisuis DSM 15480 TaxID=1121950 RepID=A0A1M6WD80_9FIRM|nr:Mur ligase family protein [Hespellia stercorisuis]SHK91661.1 UDP-N-acetylmuramyl tripeptide synthase [Hespellia stercorisuis DSM 15480]
MSLKRKMVIKFAKWVSSTSQKIRGGQGVTLPGYIARKLNPSILTSLSSDVRKKTFVVLGTNGKTTTNSILYHALTAEGQKVIINKTGSNMMNGVVSSFVLATDKNGELDADYACIEVDEIASLTVLPKIKPDYLVLTNISRDQLDRFGEVDITFQKLKEAINKTPKMTLLINGDDVLSYTLAKESKHDFITYGINEQIFDSTSRSEIRESIFCRKCGHKLEYNFFHYGQLGDYHCPHCGLTRPEAAYAASNIHLSESGSTFDVGDRSFTTGAKAPYNIYNTLAAYAALRIAGLEAPHFENMIAHYDYGNNRESVFNIGGTNIQIHLAKNPIGFQQKISLVLKDPNPKDVMILINDEYQDGEDVSWLWDVDFQYLADANANSIIATGKRGYDMRLRLKYEDIPCEVSLDLENTIRDCIENRTDNLYLIVNYTGLYSTNALLKNLSNDYAGKED